MSTVITKNLQIGADGTASNNFTIYQPASPDGTLRIGNGNTGTTSAQVVLTSAGNVGIGTSSPGVKLDTVGVMRGTFNSTSNGGETSHGLTLRQSTTSTKALIAGYSTSGSQTGAYIQAVNFGTAYEDLAIQPHGGNVGIGTSSPNERVTIASSTSASYIQICDSSTGATSGDGLFLGSFNGAAELKTKENAALAFGTNNTERARIDSSGNLLVGTTSATAQLSVFSSGGSLAASFNTSLDAAISIRSTDSVTGIEFVDPQRTSYIFYTGSSNTFSTTNSNLSVGGSLSKGSGSFKIDHPLKPATHHLVHSFIEGPQADNIYRGKAALIDGRAEVNIDEVAGMTEGTFAALNRDVQCFTSNETDWDAVRGSVSGNILTIECQNVASTATVSWLVIGERQDKHMYETDWTDENGKVIVEPLKNPEPATEGN